jgi:hypothetical protein
MKKITLAALLIITLNTPGISQEQANYDEARVPDFRLPELLKTKDGRTVSTADEWVSIRRPEIVSLFENNMYGRIPGKLGIDSWKVLEKSENALGGKAVRKQVLLTFRGNKRELSVNLLIYLPKTSRKVPVFVGYNFDGNQTVTDEPEIFITRSWVSNDPEAGNINNRATEKSRGTDKSAWQVDKIISSGYGLVTLHYGDVDPDKDDFTDGIHPLFYKPGQTMPEPDEWGSITAWAWGLGRVMDYLEKDPDIDAGRGAVMGHFRLGKTSLWAGALDQRFAIVISNNSGCGGAALSRRMFGETLAGMNQYFKHWLCDNCSKFDNNVNDLPVDQHMLIALIAPRPAYIASAEEDRWADPKGEYLGGYYASPVYELFGKKGLTSPEMPPINSPVMTSIGYHIRSGKHAVTEYDWEQYIRFADMHFKNK